MSQSAKKRERNKTKCPSLDWNLIGLPSYIKTSPTSVYLSFKFLHADKPSGRIIYVFWTFNYIFILSGMKYNQALEVLSLVLSNYWQTKQVNLRKVPQDSRYPSRVVQFGF